MSKFQLLGVLCLAAVLQGCPYESIVPAGVEPSDVPKEFIGKWVSSDNLGDDKNSFYIVSSPSKKSILVTKIDYSSYRNEFDTSMYTGQIANIKGQLFLSLKERAEAGEQTSPMEEEESKYYIYKVRPHYNFYTLDELSTDITENFQSAAEFQSFIEQHMDNELFYRENGDTYVKIPSK
jgi:hypothetical protein